MPKPDLNMGNVKLNTGKKLEHRDKQMPSGHVNIISETEFEKRKNLKAFGATVTTCGLLLLLFFFVHWTVPQTPPVPEGDGIEVNLGNAGTGEATDPTQEPGAPSSDAASMNSAPKDATATPTDPNTAPMQENPTNENDVAVNKTPEKTEKTPLANPSNLKAKAVMGRPNNGKSNGGSNGDSYDGPAKEGNSKTTSNQGNPNGKPNSDSYNGNGTGGNSGVAIKSGLKGRKINKYPSFEDDFNENAKIVVDISVDNQGNVSLASINPKGTTTTNKKMWGIALKKAKEIKLNPSTLDDSETGSLLFVFKLKED